MPRSLAGPTTRTQREKKKLGSWRWRVKLVRMRTIYCLIAVLVSLGSVYAEPQIVSRTAKIDNVELHYLTAGRGPAVILLHGYAETSRTWRPIIPLLAEKITVIAPALPW